MRVFQNKNWEYSIGQFDLLSKKKEWSVRFRLEYSMELNKGVSLRTFIINLLGLLNLVRLSLRWQKKGILIQDKKYIILLSKNEGYLRHLLPVVEELVKRQNNAVALCPAKDYEDLKSRLPGSVAKILTPYESLSDKQSGHILKAFFGSLGDINWFMSRRIKKAFLLSTSFARYGYTQRLLGEYLKRNLKPEHVLLAANDHWLWESLVYKTAKENGSHSFVVEHGMLEEVSYPMFTRKYLVWGKHSYQRMTENFGASPEEVLIAGSPYFDKLYADINARTSQVSKKDQPYITFLSQPFSADGYLSQEDYASIIQRFYSLLPLAMEHDKKLIVKLHPRENGDIYDNRPSSVELTKEQLFDVLEKSCITITVDSTAIFESAMFKVPTIQSIIPTAARQMIFANSGICLLTKSGDELLKTVQELLESQEAYAGVVQKSQQALSYYFNGMSGSLEKIVSLLTSS